MPEMIDRNYLIEQEHLNVLIVGEDSRGRALQWKLSQSYRIGNLSILPSNSNIVAFTQDPENKVDLVVIGPDDDLANGLVDDLADVGVPAFGPTRQAARIESSKPYAKRLMEKTGVPTASFAVFEDPKEAHTYIDLQQKALYVKAGGLALGKGAIECLTIEAAHSAVDDILVRKQFGTAGNEVVIEEYLQGQEISLHALCDGNTYHMFPSSQDHKRADEGNKGFNTGGMGTISPVPWFDQKSVAEAGQLVVDPVLSAMHTEGNDFSGLLYPGLIVQHGVAKVIEYNARFGDPETQVYMRRLKSDLLEVITATLAHRLDDVVLEWADDYAVCIVAASRGYPGAYDIGKRIEGVEVADCMNGVNVFLAGATEQDGQLYTSGGRVLGVTATGATLSAALDAGYAAMENIRFEGKKVRSDIGDQALRGAL